MKIFYHKSYNRFVNYVWLAVAVIFTIQFGVKIMPLYEAMLIGLSVVLFSYPLTTYLSTSVLRKAMQKNSMFYFALQFLLFTLINGLFLFFILRLFTYLEGIQIFPGSETFSGKDSLFEDFVGSMLLAIFINFGFCGLRFYEANLRLQKNLIESQLQILQAQINPHFMFNILNHVNILIRKEPELASSLLVQYTNILRYQLYSGKEEYIRIRQEVDFLKNFIAVEQVRWKNNLDVTFHCNIEQDQAKISPLLLITFIENAFKHVSRSKTEKGYIKIDIKQKDDLLVLEVKNSKYAELSMSAKKEASGIGLENIKKRLEILYPNKYNLTIAEKETEFLIVLSITL
ncbi:sensor histidine kinase [Sphingobacterium sp. Mn56C]|uniref:sensor histidine kinase n=1 Tax=Sphingobacterium sp. Mn56C TaxID=3395261 RepID=UPI003BBDE89E